MSLLRRERYVKYFFPFDKTLQKPRRAVLNARRGLRVFSERYRKLHLEALKAIDRMGDALGHDQRFARLHRHHGVAAGAVGGDFLALIKGKNGHADHFVLHERLADDLALAVVNQIGKPQLCLFFDVLIYILSSFSDSLLRILPNIKVLLRIFLPDAPGRAKQKGCPCAGMPRRPLLSNSMWQSGIKKTPSKRMESF